MLRVVRGVLAFAGAVCAVLVVRPFLLAATTVTLQRLVGTTWRTVGSRRTSARGETAFRVGPGTFRVVLSASAAYGSAVSATHRA